MGLPRRLPSTEDLATTTGTPALPPGLNSLVRSRQRRREASAMIPTIVISTPKAPGSQKSDFAKIAFSSWPDAGGVFGQDALLQGIGGHGIKINELVIVGSLLRAASLRSRTGFQGRVIQLFNFRTTKGLLEIPAELSRSFGKSKYSAHGKCGGLFVCFEWKIPAAQILPGPSRITRRTSSRPSPPVGP